MKVEIREVSPWNRTHPNLRFKVCLFEETEDGDRRYLQTRSFEGRDAAEAYKAQLEAQYSL